MRTPFHSPGLAKPLILALAAAWAGSSHAESAMGDVVVTATRSEHDARTAPASVTVIPREEIEARNPVDLLDAVRGEPGITLTGRGVGGRKTIALRGLEGKHVLQLIDGRRISASDDVVGHSDYQYGWLPMSAVERIEVIRGPMSTLYGSEALGGVVNLITRQPGDRWTGSLGISGATSGKGGGGERGGANVFAAGPVGERWGLSLIGDVSRLSPVALKEDTRYSELEGRETRSAGFATRFRPAPGHDVSLGWVDIQEDRWRGNVSGATAFEDRYDLRRSHGHVSWRGALGDWRLQAGAYVSELDVSNRRSHGVAPTRPQNLRDAVADVLATTRLGTHALTLGGELRNETLKNAGLRNGQDEVRHAALFVQDEVPLNKALMLTAGIRADQHEIFGAEYSPRAYLVWEATPELVVKGGYGHAFKAPTLKQISPHYVGSEGPHTFLGNANIKPEKSDALEIGADWQHGPFNLRGTLYHTRVTNLISPRLIRVLGPRRTYLYDNIRRAEITGAEAGFSWKVTPDLVWGGDFTWLHTKDKDSGQELTGRPGQALTSRLDWQAGAGWSMRLSVEHTGRQRDGGGAMLPAYRLWNASVAKRFGKTVHLRAGVDNLSDVRLAEKSADFGYAERGRRLFANVRFDF